MNHDSDIEEIPQSATTVTAKRGFVQAQLIQPTDALRKRAKGDESMETAAESDEDDRAALAADEEFEEIAIPSCAGGKTKEKTANGSQCPCETSDVHCKAILKEHPGVAMDLGTTKWRDLAFFDHETTHRFNGFNIRLVFDTEKQVYVVLIGKKKHEKAIKDSFLAFALPELAQVVEYLTKALAEVEDLDPHIPDRYKDDTVSADASKQEFYEVSKDLLWKSDSDRTHIRLMYRDAFRVTILRVASEEAKQTFTNWLGSKISLYKGPLIVFLAICKNILNEHFKTTYLGHKQKLQ